MSKTYPVRDRACAVCGSQKKTALYKQRFAGLSTQSLVTGYTVSVCGDCGFGFADQLPDQQAFDEYYRDMSKYEQQHTLGGGTADLIRNQATTNALEQFVPERSARILDIGCATGRMLALLKEKGYSHLLGIDPSAECGRIAREHYGVEVLPFTMSSMPEWHERFDVITLISVVEHVQMLHALVGRLAGMLSDEGLLFLEHPDVTRFSPDAGGPFQEFSTEHVNFFSRVSLSNLVRQNGFLEVHSFQEDRQAAETVKVPSSSSIFRKDKLVSKALVPDRETEVSLRAYIRNSQAIEDRVREQIDLLIGDRVEFVVWGVGTHTQHLMEATSLRRARIVAFVDSNPRYQGESLDGIPILAPNALKNMTEPILVSSRISQNEIVRQVREELCIGNDLILLY